MRDTALAIHFSSASHVHLRGSAVTDIIHKQINTSTKELRRTVHGLADVVDVAQVAERGGDARVELLEVRVDSVVELGLVDVEDVDAVTFGEEGASHAAADALWSLTS